MNDNQNLTNDLQKKNAVRDEQRRRAAEQQISKLERIRNMINRKSLRHAYDKWITGAEMRNGLERACEKISHVEHKHKLRNNFIKFRVMAAAKKRQLYVIKKSDWFAQMRRGNSLKDMWFTWLEYVRVFKLARKFLKRADLGMDRGQRSIAFYKWKQCIVDQKHQVYNDNIQELQQR